MDDNIMICYNKLTATTAAVHVGNEYLIYTIINLLGIYLQYISEGPTYVAPK